MRRLLLVFAATFCVAANVSWADVAPRIEAYQHVVATSNLPTQFDPIIRHLKTDKGLRRPELVDYIAEALVSPANQLDEQSALILLEGLQDFGDGRYRDAVAQLQAKTRSAKVKSAAGRFTRKHRKATVAQYLPGTTDFVRLRAEYSQTALAFVPDDDQARRLATFPVESSIEKLFQLMGRPHAVLTSQTLVSDGMLVHVRTQRLFVYYRGVGRVLFQYNREKGGWRSRNIIVDPDAFEEYMPYRRFAAPGAAGDQALRFTQLLSRHQPAMKVAAEKSTQSAKVEPAFLDTAAEVLLKQHRSANDWHSYDAYAWMCKLLTEHGGPRYSQVLKRVALETTDIKLKAFASKPLKKVDAGNTAPYVEGSVSLEALRAQYPPFYPQRTWVSGNL